jgi:hypothetical protein
VKEKDGSFRLSRVSGVISSIHHEKTFDFVCESLGKLLNIGNIEGIIWDEPKTLEPDYSEEAIKKLGPEPDRRAQAEASRDFYSRVNRFIKEIDSDITTNLFLYANVNESSLDVMARTSYLDYFGCDGRPWYPEDGGKQESSGKTLLGAQSGERFLSAAQKNNLSSLWLLENHNMAMADLPLLKKRLPEVLAKEVDQLIYYYYPRNLEDPETIMKLIGEGIREFH